MIKLFFVVLICVIIFSGCAAGPNPLKGKSTDAADSSAGFLLGLWHGIIVVIAFIVSWFKSSVSVYEVHNNGGWYNFGFILGVSMFFGGSSGGACKKF